MSKFFKSSLFLVISVLPLTSLASCSSSLSQYGINCQTKSNYLSLATSETNEERKQTFDLTFSNTSVAASSLNKNSNKYQEIAWTTLIFPMYAFGAALINLSLLDFDISNSSPNLAMYNSADLDLIREFLLASSNVLNQGRDNQIKFGVTGIELVFEYKKPSDNSQQNNTYGVYAQENEKLYVETKENEDSKTALFYSNYSLNLKFKLGYWNPTIDKPNQELLSAEQVSKYVSSHSSWPSNILPKHSSFTLTLNLAGSILSKYSGLTKSFETNNQQPTKNNKNSSTTNTDNKPTIETVNLNSEDFKNVNPTFSYFNFSFLNRFNPNLASGQEFNEQMINDDIQKIALLITHYTTENKDVKTLNELRDKYKGIFSLNGN